MRILLTGHKGYIGAVAGPMLRSAGHEVSGLTPIFLRAAILESRPRRFRRFAKIFAT